MVARAIAAFDGAGEAAFADMTAPSEDFVDRDLYIFVVGPDHTVVAHGETAARLGLDVTMLTDADGFAYGQAILDSATAEGAWLDYKREDPLTGEIQPKSSWLRAHDGYIFGCGIYLP
jgi:signal transduction histidine kinase